MSMPAAALFEPVQAVRWMGNKRGSLGPVAEALARAAGDGLVVDPMAGSHAITQAMNAPSAQNP